MPNGHGLLGQLFGPPDLTGEYNTKLTPLQEMQFQQWAAKTGRLRDLYDYDMRGAWLSGAGQSANGHFTDEYKKPNHPTFSVESRYSGPGRLGGQWGDNTFTPSTVNTNNLGLLGLSEYLRNAEPNVKLKVRK